MVIVLDDGPFGAGGLAVAMSTRTRSCAMMLLLWMSDLRVGKGVSDENESG